MASPKVKSLIQVIRKAGLSESELRELEKLIARLSPEDGRSGQLLNDLPPKMPTHPDELNRAICLLGNRITSDLKDKARQELMLLLGVYPTLEQAGTWKQVLTKKYKAEFAASEPPEATPPSPSKLSQPKLPPSKLSQSKPAQSKPAQSKLAQPNKQKKNKIQEQVQHFNEDADFLDRIGLGHLAIKLDVSDSEDDMGI
ncbi:MAG TPA: hypothetical protein V6C57_16855 [Coleofasciculaceae cyanobacterium]